jgi:PleD family two-component response regulator
MASKSPLEDKVVLVVDDEPDVLDSVEELLDMCLVHKARDYDTALQYILSYNYDIVILDIMGGGWIRSFEKGRIESPAHCYAHCLCPDP